MIHRVAASTDTFVQSPLDFAVYERTRNALNMARTALDTGNARLAFQPVVTARGSHKAVFYEALIRLIDQSGRIIPAVDFMDKVEDTEVGRKIDCRTLSLGLKTLKRHPDLRLSINMSARSIGYPKWTAILQKHIRNHPDVVERLILEITETSAMTMPELVISFMADLQSHGITFALDDFGAGFTAFRYLRDFSFDIIKIDGQFIQDLPDNADNQVLVQALLSIAAHFEMMPDAESVENPDVAEWLARSGTDCLQGYLFGAPSLQPSWKTGMGKQNILASIA